MPHDPHLHRCAYPGCTHWALYRSNACVVHAGLVDEPKAAQLRRRPANPFPPVEGAAGGQIPSEPLGGLEGGARGGLSDLVAFRLACLDRFLHLTLGYRPSSVDQELRHLQALSRIADRRAKSGAEDAGAEIDRFLDEVAKLAREDPCWKLDNPYGPESGYSPYITPKAPPAPPGP